MVKALDKSLVTLGFSFPTQNMLDQIISEALTILTAGNSVPSESQWVYFNRSSKGAKHCKALASGNLPACPARGFP